MTTAKTAAVRKTPARKAAAKKAVAKLPVRSAVRAAAKPPVAAAPEAALGKKRDKLVRDGFTIPKSEYAALAELKQRSAKLGHAAKKSELLRAGIKLLTGLGDAPLRAALQAVPTIKTGRPSAAAAPALPPAPVKAAKKVAKKAVQKATPPAPKKAAKKKA